MSGTSSLTWVGIVRIVVKAAILFVLLNAMFAVTDTIPALGRASLHRAGLPDRERLPFGENPQAAYNLSLFSLDAMFASHVINQPKAADEFRVAIVGDSSVWGTLLRPDETLAGQLHTLDLRTNDGRTVVAYNLGYPTISLTKDLMLLEYVVTYQPDLIVWAMTLEAFPLSAQLRSPMVQNNAPTVRALIKEYDLPLDQDDAAFVTPSFWEQTIVGQRRAMADVIRLNIYGLPWAATGIDQVYPENYTPRQEDFEADESFHELMPPELDLNALALPMLEAGMGIAGDVPVLLINEPMFISDGENSDIRYNFFYPRWAYDDYLMLMRERAAARGWHYLDLWDAIPATEYTNSAIHLTPAGEAQLARLIGDAIIDRYGR